MKGIETKKRRHLPWVPAVEIKDYCVPAARSDVCGERGS
ncbi:hypothetical protein M6B38_222600 [Iris pallida]|uniref:Uncharacterized protein n=1 Tax=Iris pallida TaxID=29817 RepID=A0AAX6DWU7_IRIPA|nr:hypothetical protein M6B38_222600 [Iris pallida]